MSIGRRFYTDNTVSTYPQRSISLASNIDANLGVITFTLNSNLTPGLVLNYNLPNVSASDFAEGTTSGTVTINGSGGATVVRTLNKYANYSNTNVSSRLEITSPAGTTLVNSANFVIAPFTPITIIGGTTSTVNANTVHTFTTNGSFTVSSLGDLSGSQPIRTVIVAGGGAGGAGGYTNKTSAIGRTRQFFSGAGGGAGGIIDQLLTPNNFSLTTYNVSIGQGGDANVFTFAANALSITNEPIGKGGNTSITFSGNSTVFSNLLAIGGGLGSSLTSTYANGGSGAGSGYDGTDPEYITGNGTTGQGTKGGNAARALPTFGGANNTSSIFVAGGGGGGYSSSGGNADILLTTAYYTIGGSGGSGFNAANIVNSNVYYSGGGGGALGHPGSEGGQLPGAGGSNSGGDGVWNAVGGNGKTYGGGGGGGSYDWQSLIPNVRRGGNGKEGIIHITYESRFRVLKPA